MPQTNDVLLWQPSYGGSVLLLVTGVDTVNGSVCPKGVPADRQPWDRTLMLTEPGDKWVVIPWTPET